LSRVAEGILYEFDRGYLNALVDTHGDTYRIAEPFPHVVIDDFLPESAASGVLDEWPDFHTIDWTTYDNRHELKHVCSDVTRMGPGTRGLVAAFNGSAFVRFLERMTGIGPLVTDPHLVAAGLFDVQPGGHLDAHTDFTQGAGTRLARRINVLYYLNRGWREDHGGQLELWSMKPLRCVHSIVPAFNRLVIFNTTLTALHGHPVPLRLTCRGGAESASPRTTSPRTGRSEKRYQDATAWSSPTPRASAPQAARKRSGTSPFHHSSNAADVAYADPAVNSPDRRTREAERHPPICNR
jgi:hypothetical protein